jgi:hypothetical protein
MTIPPDALSHIVEKMTLINARLDAQATEVVALRHRDEQHDAPRRVQATSPVVLPLHHHTYTSVSARPHRPRNLLLPSPTINTHEVACRL